MPAPANYDRWERLPDGSYRRRVPPQQPRSRALAAVTASQSQVDDLGLESLGAAHPPAMVEAAQARATQAAADLAHDLGVDLAAVEGTGKQGRITKADVERASE